MHVLGVLFQTLMKFLGNLAIKDDKYSHKIETTWSHEINRIGLIVGTNVENNNSVHKEYWNKPSYVRNVLVNIYTCRCYVVYK